MMKQFLLIILAMLVFSMSAVAQDEEDAKTVIDQVIEDAMQGLEEDNLKEDGRRFAPEGCNFEMTFPEAPLKLKRCPSGTGQCYEITSYTMVYDMRTTVEISVSCVPSPPANYGRYTRPVIETVLRGMEAKAGVDEAQITVDEQPTMRQGSLVGSGAYGRDQQIYNAQIWIGQASVMTIEAKLIGPSHDRADKIFADILKTARLKPS